MLGLADPGEQPPILNGMDRRDVLGGAVALAVTVLPQGVATAGRIDEADGKQNYRPAHTFATAARRLLPLSA